MSNEIDFKNKIKANSSLFTNFVKNAVSASPKVQNNFLDVSSQVALTVQKIIEDANLLMNLDYKGKDFWSENRCKTSCFVDGGVDKTSIIEALEDYYLNNREEAFVSQIEQKKTSLTWGHLANEFDKLYKKSDNV